MKMSILTKERANLGFTFVELLMALVILAVLVALLLGVVTKAQKQSDLSRCSNHLRQLQIAFTGYVTDSNGVLPDKSPKRLFPYIGIPEDDIYRETAYTCPAIQRTENAAVGPYHRNIAINLYATTEKALDSDRFTRIQTPSKMLLFSEARPMGDAVSPLGRRGKSYISNTRLEDVDKVLWPHNDLQNVVFVDGSVRRVDKDEFYQEGRWNTFFWRGYEK